MKSIKVTNTGGPEVLELEEITLDKPGADEVQIEHVSIGLNYIDTYHRSGLYPLQLPTGIGLEAAGIIKEIGSNVSNFSVGDKVAYAAAPLGSYSTHRNYPSKNIVKVPDNIDLEIISSAMTKGMTTFYLLHKTYVPKKGETVLFHAAAGGVGQFFCQWAKSLGLKVIGTVGSQEKIEIAKKYGCEEVINYSKEDFAKKVMELTDGKGVSVVYDGVGKSTYDKSIEFLKLRGTMVSFGNASGALDPIIVSKSLQPKCIYFVRPAMNQYFTNSDEIHEAASMLFKQISSGNVKIEIYKKYKLEDTVQAHKDLEGRRITGPAVIIP